MPCSFRSSFGLFVLVSNSMVLCMALVPLPAGITHPTMEHAPMTRDGEYVMFVSCVDY